MSAINEISTAGVTQSTSSQENTPSKETSSETKKSTTGMTISDGNTAATAATDEEEDLRKLQAEIVKMEEEAARIAQETAELEKEKASKTGDSTTTGSSSNPNGGVTTAGGAASGEGANRDGLSIYVGQVEYTATPEELCAHFEPCGTVERVTIVCDKFSGRPKGYAYLEFQTEDGVTNAIKLDGSGFKGRNLKVTHKRVNEPNFHFNQAARGGGRSGRMGGRGFRGRFGGGRGGRGRGLYRGGYSGGFAGYHPYY